jgi:hypothetical protein
MTAARRDSLARYVDLLGEQLPFVTRPELRHRMHEKIVAASNEWARMIEAEQRDLRSAAAHAFLADLRRAVADDLVEQQHQVEPEVVDLGAAPPLDPVSTLTCAPAAPPATLAA